MLWAETPPPITSTMDEPDDNHLDDVSLASSIPTDLSLSEISDIKFDHNRKSAGLKSKKQQQKDKDKIARQLLEKKQLEHDLQLVKIELNQKEYLLENVRTEYKMKVEDMEEKLNEYKHQKKLLMAKTESQLSLQQVGVQFSSSHPCHLYITLL